MQLRSFTFGITSFLWFTSILAIAAIIFLCVLSLTSMQVVGQKALEVRQVKLPEVEDTQRSMINIESLRRLAEVVYLAGDPQTRRMARIRAQAMSTESVFTRNSDSSAQSKRLIDRINKLADLRDEEFSYQRRLDSLERDFIQSMFNIALILGDDAAFSKISKPGLAVSSFWHNANETPRTSLADKNKQRVEDLARFEALETLCLQQAAQTPALFGECARQAEFRNEYQQIITGMAANNTAAYASWQGIDEALRELRDVVRTNAEFETKDALFSIERQSKEAVKASLWLVGGGILFFLVYLVVLHFVLVRPVRWAGRKLMQIQHGILDTPAPAIYIKELYQVGDLLDRFSAHIAELTSQASQFAEDAAEKRDLEALMAAVFRLSVDGYIIWAPGGKCTINAELLRILGVETIEEVEEHWDSFGLTKREILPALFEHIKAEGFSRKELTITTSYGDHIPFEVSYLPIQRQNGMGILAYFRDLRRQKLTEEALRTARDRAEEAAQVKSDFLARMSHEIRTPMNGVLGLTEVALRESPPLAQKIYLEKIQASARILLRVINDILDFSKMESGKFALENRVFPFERMISTATGLFSFQAAEKGLVFTVEADNDIPEYLVGDEMRLSQVLLNLCGNAMKFTEQGCVTVKVAVESDDENGLRLRFSILDTGIGMTQEQIDSLFQPFAQADSSTTRKYGGTGLGLVISDLLVKLMQGTITVTSAPGKGSVFSFSVLLKRQESAAPVFETRPASELAGDTMADSSHELEGLRILLAEDNEINQEVALALLESLGCSVIVAGNGQEALDILATKEVDCIFMDIQMPVMDGLTATRTIRQDPRETVRNLPIIAMTAHAMQEDREKSIDAGMSRHITKPIDFEELRSALLFAAGKSAPKA